MSFVCVFVCDKFDCVCEKAVAELQGIVNELCLCVTGLVVFMCDSTKSLSRRNRRVMDSRGQ
jgi:hypothetical protein